MNTPSTVRTVARASSGRSPNLRLVEAIDRGVLPPEYVAAILGPEGTRDALHCLRRTRIVESD